jgi:hypothetical protein
MFDDPLGHHWNVANAHRGVTPEEMERRAVEAMGAAADYLRIQHVPRPLVRGAGVFETARSGRGPKQRSIGPLDERTDLPVR